MCRRNHCMNTNSCSYHHTSCSPHNNHAPYAPYASYGGHSAVQAHGPIYSPPEAILAAARGCGHGRRRRHRRGNRGGLLALLFGIAREQLERRAAAREGEGIDSEGRIHESSSSHEHEWRREDEYGHERKEGVKAEAGGAGAGAARDRYHIGTVLHNAMPGAPEGPPSYEAATMKTG